MLRFVAALAHAVRRGQVLDALGLRAGGDVELEQQLARALHRAELVRTTMPSSAGRLQALSSVLSPVGRVLTSTTHRRQAPYGAQAVVVAQRGNRNAEKARGLQHGGARLHLALTMPLIVSFGTQIAPESTRTALG